MTYLTGFADAHMHSNDVDTMGGYPDIDGASILLSCTAKYDQWEHVSETAAEDDRVYPFYGMHPWYVNDAPSDLPDLLRSFLEEHPRSGVGEIGLDEGHPDYEKQIGLFNEQLKVAAEIDRPVTMHMLHETPDILRSVKKYGRGVPIILHSFSGPDSYIKAFEKEDCYFSVSPRILMKSATKITQLLKEIPEDRLLIETDAPMRDRHCFTMSAFIEALSPCLGMTPQELIDLTKRNTERVIA
ncbi:MAG: TatD family hydrolase [Candidatus Methanomethylophilaceae archaeon]|jgi:TatD DNase family protein